jgi:hypothetical protein
MYLCSLGENTIIIGLISLLNNGSPFLKRLYLLARSFLEGGLLGLYKAKLNWIRNLRSKIRSVDDEKCLRFLYSISHLNLVFSVLAFGWLLSFGYRVERNCRHFTVLFVTRMSIKLWFTRCLHVYI